MQKRKAVPDAYLTAWLRVGGAAMAPELAWTAPHVFYVGRREPAG